MPPPYQIWTSISISILGNLKKYDFLIFVNVHIVYNFFDCVLIENLVPNFSHLEGDGNEKGGITWYNHIRLGRKCVTKSVKLGPFQQVRYSSLAVQGPKLFNSLPKNIRNLKNCDIHDFKKMLDKYLSSIPDEPLLPSYVKFRRADTNSIVDMISIGLSKLDAWRLHRSKSK